MISYFKTLIFFVIPFQIITANTITVEAPKILLKNIDFNVTLQGDFSTDGQYLLEHDGTTYFTSETSVERITFENIRTNILGNTSFSLRNNDQEIFEFEKNTIRPWFSVLPPIIAIALAFLTKSIVPSLFVAIWFGAWAINGLTFAGILSGLLDTFNVFILNTIINRDHACLLYTSPSPRDLSTSRMPSSA